MKNDIYFSLIRDLKITGNNRETGNKVEISRLQKEQLSFPYKIKTGNIYIIIDYSILS